MELRDIEIFLTLAEELHFGRTAERLHVSPARITQAIKKQERQIGTQLFVRNNRSVLLTPAGVRLRDDLRPIYHALGESVERAKREAQNKNEALRLGMLSTNTAELRPLFDAFAAHRPHCEIQLRYISFSDPFGPLRAREVDVLLAWLPVEERDLTVGPIISTEHPVLAVSATHRLATRTWVSYEDLGDEIVMGGAHPGYWREAIVPTRTPSGRPIRIGPNVSTGEEMLPILAAGEAVSPVYGHSTRYYARPDTVHVPIRDAPPLRWALIWSTAAENDLIRHFAHAARDVGELEF
ncbi:LysR family transcriptional regulator [Nonomuraea sp. NPDC049695]|uniref:LysR family transcriptional regulator n=1 Tax=Nonomuraea sp. NPDC049695 TaxID=3154734 RepID=UPI003431BDDF